MRPLTPYRGFSASFGFDPEDVVYHGRVLGTHGIVTFEAEAIDGLQQAFHDSVDDYLAFCGERDIDPGPFDG